MEPCSPAQKVKSGKIIISGELSLEPESKMWEKILSNVIEREKEIYFAKMVMENTVFILSVSDDWEQPPNCNSGVGASSPDLLFWAMGIWLPGEQYPRPTFEHEKKFHFKTPCLYKTTQLLNPSTSQLFKTKTPISFLPCPAVFSSVWYEKRNLSYRFCPH